MPRDSSATRTSIMDAAEALILDQGFAATSVDRIIENAGVTKGTFFYHYATKADLALALVQRFAVSDMNHLTQGLARAEELSRDPLQQILIFVGLFKEELAQLTEPYPGCLFASYCYEAQLFDDRTHAVIRDAMREWRERLGDKFDAAIKRYPPRLPVTPRGLADMITVIFEGAFILSKTMNEPGLVAQQLGHYRDYLELVFSPADR